MAIDNFLVAIKDTRLNQKMLLLEETRLTYESDPLSASLALSIAGCSIVAAGDQVLRGS